MNKKRVINSVLYTVIGIALIALDQVTKWLVAAYIPYGTNIPVIDGFFDLSHVLNTGAAWGMMRDKTILLSVVTLIACGFLIYLLCVTVNPWLNASFLMILSGAVGNLIDRVFRGEVVDFLSFHFGSYDFPSFNVADICITCGCILLMVVVIFVARGDRKMFRTGSLADRFLSDKKTEADDAAES